jgi:hypothetical protein
MAEAAMFLSEPRQSRQTPLRHREMQAMEDALAFLRALKPAARGFQLEQIPRISQSARRRLRLATEQWFPVASFFRVILSISIAL